MANALTRELLVSFLLEDIAEASSVDDAHVSEDAKAALRLLQHDLEQEQVSLVDKRIAQGIHAACTSDEQEITRIIREERQALVDRQCAQRLNEDPTINVHLAHPPLTRIPSDASLATLNTFNTPSRSFDDDMYSDDDDDDDIKTIISGVRETRLQRLVSCSVCAYEVPAVLSMQSECSHIYCKSCLSSLYTSAVKDRSLFPPRCCRRELSFADSQTFLPAHVKALFLERTVEWNTTDPIYCSNQICSRFINPAHVASFEGAPVANCPDCGSSTCVKCKQVAHGHRECPNDESLQQLESLANSEGWQHCPGCNAMVQLTYGCNHITCRCRYEFCYTCRKEWKSCACELYSEEQLHGQALRAAGPRADRAQVAVIANNLRQRHECQHTHFTFTTNGNKECEICSDTLPIFINVCNGCAMRVCRRCQLNRL